MSALKFSQIQDMLITLATRMNRAEQAIKENGVAVADALSRVSELEKKEEEREAVKEGTWKSGETTTEGTAGSIYLSETTNETDEPIYKFKIDEIPKYTPASPNDKTYVFTPTDAIEIKMPAGATFPDITVNAKDAAETPAEITYKLTYADGAFTLTMQDGYTIPDTPLEITLDAVAEVEFPREVEPEPEA